MAVYKRGKWYWMHEWVNGVEYRMTLDTRNWQEALKRHKERLQAIAEGKLGSIGRTAQESFNNAVDAYLEERMLHTAERTKLTDAERSHSLRRFFGEVNLRRITAGKVVEYQIARRKAVSGRTVNLEVGLLRRIMKKHKQWVRLADDVKMLPEKPKPARVLTTEEKAALLEAAASRPDWMIARCAAILALNTTMRGCELRGLRRKDVDLFERTLTIRRDSTKTDAGARVIPLNRDAVLALSELLTRADRLGSSDPDHFVFPACEGGIIDLTEPMKSWRSAWKSLTKAAGLDGFRFHDLRHHAITELCEAGLSDMTIMGIAGHVTREMLQHYSHIRMKAKREAVAMLETREVAIQTSLTTQVSTPENIEAERVRPN